MSGSGAIKHSASLATLNHRGTENIEQGMKKLNMMQRSNRGPESCSPELRDAMIPTPASLLKSSVPSCVLCG